MTHKVYWDDANKKDIIRVDVIGVWTWKDYDEIVLKFAEMIATVEHRVDVIADMREAGSLPTKGDAAQHVKRGRQIRPDNFGMTVNVGTDPLTKVALDAGVTLSGTKELRPLVDTIEEAYTVIAKARKTAD